MIVCLQGHSSDASDLKVVELVSEVRVSWMTPMATDMNSLLFGDTIKYMYGDVKTFVACDCLGNLG